MVRTRTSLKEIFRFFYSECAEKGDKCSLLFKSELQLPPSPCATLSHVISVHSVLWALCLFSSPAVCVSFLVLQSLCSLPSLAVLIYHPKSWDLCVTSPFLRSLCAPLSPIFCHHLLNAPHISILQCPSLSCSKVGSYALHHCNPSLVHHLKRGNK